MLWLWLWAFVLCLNQALGRESRTDAKQVVSLLQAVCPGCSRKDGARNHCQDTGLGWGSPFFFGSLDSVTPSEGVLELQHIFLYITSYFPSLLPCLLPFCCFSSNARNTKEADQWSMWLHWCRGSVFCSFSAPFPLYLKPCLII